MSFGIFTKGQNESLDFAQQHLAQDLPLEFSEAFDAAWREGILFGQSVSASTARMQGTQEFLDSIRVKTGATLTNPTFAPIGGETTALEELNGQIATLAPKFPDLGLKPMTAEDLDRLGEDKARRARQAYLRASKREMGWGGTLGLLLGTGAAGAVDPVNLVTLPLAAPRALGIVGTALATAGITGGTQIGIEAVAAPFKERVEPGYGASGEAQRNVLGAAVAGGVLGGGVKGLAAIWSRYKTGSWPRHIRDAGNVVESEGQIAATNVFPSVEGEVAHRSALQKAIDDLVSGRPVDVSDDITPDLLRAYGARLDPVLEARTKALAAEESAFALERAGVRLPASMERLSELQLGEIRTSAVALEQEAATARAALRGEERSIAARRAAVEARAPEREALRAEVDGLRTDLAAVEQRLAEARAPNDPATQARLVAIETNLSDLRLTAARRASLEAERATIMETVAATAPTDTRTIGRMEAEAKGLRVALSRKEKASVRAEPTTAPGPGRTDPVEAQRARAGHWTEQMRKRIQGLAREVGYDMPREEAATVAAAIARAR